MKSVLVLVMESCPACHDFMPRFGRLAAPYREQGMPVSIYDLDKHPQAAALADRLKVKVTPTTVTIGSKGAKVVAEGAIDDGRIGRLLAAAAKG